MAIRFRKIIIPAGPTYQLHTKIKKYMVGAHMAPHVISLLPLLYARRVEGGSGGAEHHLSLYPPRPRERGKEQRAEVGEKRSTRRPGKSGRRGAALIVASMGEWMAQRRREERSRSAHRCSILARLALPSPCANQLHRRSRLLFARERRGE